jgi:hypothetical protein
MPDDGTDPRPKLDPFLISYISVPPLLELGYRTIGLIREPYERLISAFLHIFVWRWGTPIENYDQLEASGRAGYLAITGEDQRFNGLTFRHFIEHCIECISQRSSEPNLDGHWNTQIPFAFLENKFRYDFLFSLDQASDFYERLSILTGSHTKERHLNGHLRTTRRDDYLVDVNTLAYCRDASLHGYGNFFDAGLYDAIRRAYLPDYYYYDRICRTDLSNFSDYDEHVRRQR